MTVFDDSVRPSEPPTPEAGECLYCYLERSVESYGCRGHQGAERWRYAQPTSMPGLTTWLQHRGGFCDCEVLMNVWDRRDRAPEYEPLFCAGAEQRLQNDDW